MNNTLKTILVSAATSLAVYLTIFHPWLFIIFGYFGIGAFLTKQIWNEGNRRWAHDYYGLQKYDGAIDFFVIRVCLTIVWPLSLIACFHEIKKEIKYNYHPNKSVAFRSPIYLKED